MPTPIPYPLINGYRHSFTSITLKLDRTEIIGFKSANYNRTRSRTMVYGNNVDAIGKTRGINDYKADFEVYLAEYNYLMQKLGPGYGDKFFQILVVAREDGFDVIQDELNGCTIDETDASNSQGTDPTVRKITVNPVKILFGGLDDNGTPIIPPRT